MALHKLIDFGPIGFPPQTLPMNFPFKFLELGISYFLIKFKFGEEDMITIQKTDKHIKPHLQIITTQP